MEKFFADLAESSGRQAPAPKEKKRNPNYIEDPQARAAAVNDYAADLIAKYGSEENYKQGIEQGPVHEFFIGLKEKDKRA